MNIVCKIIPVSIWMEYFCGVEVLIRVSSAHNHSQFVVLQLDSGARMEISTMEHIRYLVEDSNLRPGGVESGVGPPVVQIGRGQVQTLSFPNYRVPRVAASHQDLIPDHNQLKE